ncbi:MAG: serine/threonine protein kinase [Gemmatimonadaceae bacterium]|nr:serine/threonine protein kinase [Gemmatimonadaceae bacterium]
MTSSTQEFLSLQSALAGEYSLQRELGRGGMGIVYLARDVQLDRDVAIKVLPQPMAENTASRQRFLREARTAAGLSHPHIVPIHRVGEASGFVYFVMSYVEGETLGERLRTRGPLSSVDAARVMREVAWALAYAHGRGVVHRDVKPDNILLEAGTGRALVTDFGIASTTAAEASDMSSAISSAGALAPVMGTAHFISPEQAAGETIDGRSDLYALGVVGYLATSGRLPFDSRTVPALLLRQATEVAPGVRTVAPGLSSALASVIDRCLLRDPVARFPDGETLAAALAPTSDARPSLPPTLRAWLNARNPLLVPYAGWGTAFGALTLANFIAWISGNRPAGPADIGILAAITSAPLLPLVGYHVNQAVRQFRAGHTLADLRAAIEVARRERTEAAALTESTYRETVWHRALRVLTVASAPWFAVTIGLLMAGVIHENRTNLVWIFLPLFSTLFFGAISNALDVPFVPARVREWWQSGIRDRLWNSRVGAWLAKRLGAPERSRVVEAGAFRATEAALSVAASDLYAALPAAHRTQLADLPATVAALEARAAEARAELDVLDAMAAAAPTDAELMTNRRAVATAHLTKSVAALEGIRIDLLRLHAGANDLAPLTTLIDAARQLGDEVSRLADAQQEVEGIVRGRDTP